MASSPPYQRIRRYEALGRVTGNRVVQSALSRVDATTRSEGVSLKYVERGTEVYTLDGHSHAVRAGQFLVINHHQTYHVGFEAHQPVRGLCIYLTPALMEEVQRPWRQSLEGPADPTGHVFCEAVYVAAQTPLGPPLRRLFQQLHDPAFHAPLWDASAWFHLLAQSLVEQQAGVHVDVNRLPARRLSTRREVYRRVLRARTLLDDDYAAPWSLHDLADVACLSPYHLLRSFKHLQGCTPHQYQLRQRIAAAQAQLRQTNAPITAVALAVGFPDLASFSKAFKRHTGQTPSAYRVQGEAPLR
ncbi:MAG: AraC family transcriptional regulator [Bacteroidota bacterium]